MRKKIIGILLAVSFLLLAVNISIGILNKEEEIPVETEVDSRIIDSVFTSSITDFALDSTWVDKKFIDNENYDSLNYVYRVRVPADLPIVVILQDLNKKFEPYPVQIISEEKVINRNTLVDFLSDGFVKLQASFYVEHQRIRDHSKFSLIINDFVMVDEFRQDEILSSKQMLTVSVTPSAKAFSLKEKIDISNKSYCIEINDNIDEDEYKLEIKGTKISLKESIRRIVRDFNEADLYYIDDKSDLFNSAVYNFVKDEFESFGITLYTKSDFIQLPAVYTEAKSLFEFYLKSAVNKPGKILLIEETTFLQLDGELQKAKRIGAKFYTPSQLIELNDALVN